MCAVSIVLYGNSWNISIHSDPDDKHPCQVLAVGIGVSGTQLPIQAEVTVHAASELRPRGARDGNGVRPRPLQGP